MTREETDDEINVGDIIIVDNERHNNEKGMVIDFTEDCDYAYPYIVLFGDRKHGNIYSEAVAKSELHKIW